MSIGVLIVGLGQIGMSYDLHLDAGSHVYSHARAFDQHPRFHLLGGVDPDSSRRHTFEEAYRSRAYEDIESALRYLRPDLVTIAVTTRNHGEVLLRVLDQSAPKLILCEKPLSYDLQEARRMVQACAAKGVMLFVNYMRRSDSGVIEIKRRIDAGEIAAPIKGVAWYSKGFLHNGSHFFNLLEYWLGGARKSVVLNRGRMWDETDPEPDVQVEFDRGTVVFLSGWEESFSHYTAELLSSNGRLRYERGGEVIQWQPTQPATHFRGYTVLSAEPEGIDSGMPRYQLNVAEQLARAFDGREAHLCEGADALRTMESMKEIIEWI